MEWESNSRKTSRITICTLCHDNWIDSMVWVATRTLCNRKIGKISLVGCNGRVIISTLRLISPLCKCSADIFMPKDSMLLRCSPLSLLREMDCIPGQIHSSTSFLSLVTLAYLSFLDQKVKMMRLHISLCQEQSCTRLIDLFAMGQSLRDTSKMEAANLYKNLSDR